MKQLPHRVSQSERELDRKRERERDRDNKRDGVGKLMHVMALTKTH